MLVQLKNLALIENTNKFALGLIVIFKGIFNVKQIYILLHSCNRTMCVYFKHAF